jgi:hypothetical protein
MDWIPALDKATTSAFLLFHFWASNQNTNI